MSRALKFIVQTPLQLREDQISFEESHFPHKFFKRAIANRKLVEEHAKEGWQVNFTGPANDKFDLRGTFCGWCAGKRDQRNHSS